MTTTTVREHPRNLPSKRPDPFQDIIDARLEARRKNAERLTSSHSKRGITATAWAWVKRRIE